MKKTTVFIKAVLAYAILAVLSVLAINAFFVAADIIISRGIAIETLDQRAYEMRMIEYYSSHNPITRVMADRTLSEGLRSLTAILTMASPFLFLWGVRKYNLRKSK